jgi:CcmD family protein
MPLRLLPFLLLLVAAPAAAQDGAALPPPPYQSPMRDTCQAELDKDPVWSAALEQRYVGEFHERESTVAMADQRHVYLAYGALWVLTAGFLALMFLRQRRLAAEIERLEDEVKKAAAS